MSLSNPDSSRGRRCVDCLIDEMNSLLDRHIQEYSITQVEIVGVLECMKHHVLKLYLCTEDEEEEGDDDATK